MKKFNNYDFIFFVGLLIWFCGTWYFGWNDKAITTGEKITDNLGALFMLYGGLNSFVRGIKTDVIINNYTVNAPIKREN